MSLSDSILLQINQKQINKKKTSYNDLLTKMVSNYSSVNSAKAALSRVLKNLIAFGDIEKKKDDYFLTEKGKMTVESKLKNKILITINDLLEKSKKKSSLEYVDDIVKNLQIFLERSKEDPNLLKTGKTASNFYISDLNYLKKEIDTSVSHYNYISSILTNQIKVLEDQNFEDYFVLNLDENLFKILSFLIKKYNLEEINIDCNNQYPQTINFFKNFDFLVKKSDFIFRLKINNLNLLQKKLLENFETSLSMRFKIYLTEILVTFSFGKVYFFGPFTIINQIREKYKELKEL